MAFRSPLLYAIQGDTAAASTVFRYVFTIRPTAPLIAQFLHTTSPTLTTPLVCIYILSQLTELAAEKEFRDVGFFAIIKETGLDDQGILDFYEKFFRFPVYKDGRQGVYKAMGSRSFFSFPTMNPCKLMQMIRNARRRHKEMGIKWTVPKGDFSLMGGLLVFNARGEIVYEYSEESFETFPSQGLRLAIRAAIAEQKQVQSPEQTRLAI